MEQARHIYLAWQDDAPNAKERVSASSLRVFVKTKHHNTNSRRRMHDASVAFEREIIIWNKTQQGQAFTIHSHVEHYPSSSSILHPTLQYTEH